MSDTNPLFYIKDCSNQLDKELNNFADLTHKPLIISKGLESGNPYPEVNKSFKVDLETPNDRLVSNNDVVCTPNETEDEQEYIESVIKTLLGMEEMLRPKNTNIIRNQVYFSYSIRKRLVLWMINVHHKYCSDVQTIHLAVNILDRFCSTFSLKHHYQLYGVSCLWIANKYQEKNNSTCFNRWVHNVVFKRFGKFALKFTESLILKCIDFRIGVPTCFEFYSLLSVHKGLTFSESPTFNLLAEYLMDLTLTVESDFFYKQLPSYVASLCMDLALRISRNISYELVSMKGGVDFPCKPILVLIGMAINPPDTILKKHSNNILNDPKQIVLNWFNSQNKILFSPPNMQNEFEAKSITSNTEPLTPPQTPYFSCIFKKSYLD